MKSVFSKCGFWALLVSLNLMLACGGGGGGGGTPPPPPQSSPVITTNTLPSASVGQSYSATVAASNVGSSANWSISSGTLPVGLSLSGSGATAQISGTPLQTGTSTFTLKVADGSQSATKSLSILVQQSASITTSKLDDAVIGKSYYGTVVAVGLGEFPTWSVTAGALPPGLSCCNSPDDVTVISGTATQTGDYNFTLRATNGSLTASKDFTLKVTPNVVSITTRSLPAGDTATVYDQIVEAANGNLPRTWSIIAGSLPPGVSFDPSYYNAKLFGIPTKSGVFPFTIQVSDGQSKATADFSITVALAPLTIQSSFVNDGIIGDSYWASFYTSGGSGPKTWSIAEGSLPAGITLDASTGKLSGTLTSAGTFAFTVRVDDESGFATKPYTVKVAERLTIVTPTLPNGTVNTPYSVQLQATGGQPPFTWSSNVSLPPGISLSADGLLQGTPGLPWKTTGLLMVTDSSSPHQQAGANLLLTVDGPLQISANAIPRAVIGQAYSALLRAFGGTTPHRWSITSGSLPSGLTLDPATGSLSGMPTGLASDSSFTVQVTDSSATPLTAARDYSIHTQTSLGRNDTIQTATFVDGLITVNGSISPYDTSGADQDYYRMVAPAGRWIQISMASYSNIDPVVEIVDANGIRFQTCSFVYSINAQPCLFDTHGSNPAQNGNPLVMWFETPGNAETVFYMHVLDYFGGARPDFQYQLWFNSATLY